MKLNAFTFLLAVTAIFVSPAFAQQTTDPIKKFSDIAVNMSADQQKACVAPRVNTREQCVAEFEAALALVAEVTGWQVLLAKAMQDNDADRVAFFKGKHTRSVEFGLKVVGEIERRYLSDSSEPSQLNPKSK